MAVDEAPAGYTPPANQPTRARDRRGVVAYMARNGVAANLLMVAMLVLGVISFQNIVQEVFAEASLDTVSVSVVYPGATPEEIEQSVIQKVEQAVESVEGVQDITATASESVGTVLVQLELGADMARALDEVKAAIDQIQTLPDDTEEPSVREVTTRQSVLRVALYGDVPERTLKETAYELEEALSGLPDVSFVDTSTVRDYEISIEVDQDRLQSLGLSLTDIQRAVGADSLDTPAGTIDTATREVRIRTVGRNYDARDFGEIALRTTADGRILRLRDVATISDGFEDNDLVARFNGKPVAFVEVFRTSDERVLDIADAVKTHLAEEFGPNAPPGISYEVWNDTSQLLNDRLGLLIDNAIFGLILVLVALTLFLDVRLAFWTAVGIGVTFIGAIFMLDLFGSSINMFSLFGFILALGLVVDDAVVVGENIYAERESGRSGLGAAIAGTQRVVKPVIFAVLTTVAAFSPLFAVGGGIGAILSDIPKVVVAVLLLSVIEAMLILPYHLSHLPAAGEAAKNRVTIFFERIQRAVDKRFQAFVQGPLDGALRFAVRMPYLMLASGIALLIVFVAMVPAGILKVAFFPQIEGNSINAQLEMPAGATINVTEATVAQIEAAAERVRVRMIELEGGRDPVDATYTTIGASAVRGGPEGISQTLSANLATINYNLLSAGERDISALQFEEAWRAELGDVPAARSLSITSSLVSFGAPVAVRLSHPDEAVLAIAGERLQRSLSDIDGVFDVESDADAGLQEIELRLKPAARTLGITVQDLAAQVRAAFFGAEAVRVQRGREDVRVYVRLPESERDSIADIENYRVRVPGAGLPGNGGQVPVGTLAEVSFSEAPSVIRRDEGRRVTTITADVEDEKVTGNDVAAVLEAGILPELRSDYPALVAEFGGEQEEQQESFGDLGVAFALALIAIYALLAIPFKSYWQPLIIMAAIPFGIIGALLGHLLLGIPVGILSMFGIIALSGVVINGSLVLIDFVNENLATGMDRVEAIVGAAKSRFRPIMLTAVTTFLGVAPITFETSLQAQFLIPMSASLGFGVLFGTILLQLLIPALCILQLRAGDRFRRWFGRDRPAVAHTAENAALPAR